MKKVCEYIYMYMFYLKRIFIIVQIPDRCDSSENDWESDYCHSLEDSEEPETSFHLGNQTTAEDPPNQKTGISGTIV